MEKERENQYQSFIDDEDQAAFEINQQITSAYSSGVVDQKYGDNPYYPRSADENTQQ